MNRSLRCEKVECLCQGSLQRFQDLDEVGILDKVVRECIRSMIQDKRAR